MGGCVIVTYILDIWIHSIPNELVMFPNLVFCSDTTLSIDLELVTLVLMSNVISAPPVLYVIYISRDIGLAAVPQGI